MGAIYATINLDRKTYFELPFVCLKTYAPGIIPDETKAKELFIKEVEIWMLLGKYDLILNAYKIVFIEERPYVVLQYADYGTLNDLSKGNYNPIEDSRDKARSLSWLWQLAAGLKYIYDSLDRCHGDLHLGNVFLTNGGLLLKIGDFGLTALKQQSGPESINAEKVNILRIIWFILTGLNEDYDTVKKSAGTSLIPDVYRQIIFNYINSDDTGLSELIASHLRLHSEYVCLETGVTPLLPEEHHANVIKEKMSSINKLLGGFGSEIIRFEHHKLPEHYFDESEALLWAGNREKSLDRFLEFLRYYPENSGIENE